MKILGWVILVIGFWTGSSNDTVLAQDTTRRLEKFFVTLKNGERIEGHDGVLSDESFSGKIDINGEKLAVKKSDIQALYASGGSKAVKMGLLGALAGLAIGAGTIIFSDDGVEKNSAPKETILYLTAGGGLIGALIGMADTQWEKVNIE